MPANFEAPPSLYIVFFVEFKSRLAALPSMIRLKLISGVVGGFCRLKR